MPVDYDVQIDLSLGLGLGKRGVAMVSLEHLTNRNRGPSDTSSRWTRFHAEKKGIRVFGIAESFTKSCVTSTLAGIVMRRDLIIDGMVFGTATIRGDDSTQNILTMFRSLKRNDVNCIMLDGLIISMYNIIHGAEIRGKTGVPVIAITFKDSEGLEGTIERHFPNNSKLKLEQYRNLGQRDQILLKTGKSVFLRCWGLSSKEASAIVNSFTLQGSIPEPIRIAKLAARASIRRSSQ